MRVLDVCRRVLRHAGEKLRGEWESWSRRKKVAVSVCAVIGALVLGAVVFCLKVSPYYWMPNEISIPNGSGVKAYFVNVQDKSHSDVLARKRKTGYASTRNYLDYERFSEISSPYIFALVRVESVRGINTYRPYQVEGSELKLQDRPVDPESVVNGWIGDAIVEATVEAVMVDLHATPLQVGQRVLIYKDGREGYTSFQEWSEPEYQPIVGETYWVRMQCTADMFDHTREAYYEPFYSYLADYHVEDAGSDFFALRKEELTQEVFYKQMKQIGIESWQLQYALQEWEGKEFVCGR